MTKKRVFSGIQPTGNTHLGNYLGAIRRWAAEQADKTNFFCVVDLHSLTVPQAPAQLRHETRSMAALLLACGIDPRQSTVFIQSHVPAHAEGCWLLNCITPLGWLQRMTQFKDKSARQESVLTGLLADVLNLIGALATVPQADPTRIGMWGHSMGCLLYTSFSSGMVVSRTNSKPYVRVMSYSFQERTSRKDR